MSILDIYKLWGNTRTILSHISLSNHVIVIITKKKLLEYINLYKSVKILEMLISVDSETNPFSLY